MEAEKTYQNKVARTIQQKRTGEGALEFTDNRPAGILQAVAEPIQRLEDEDETLQGKFEQPLQRMSENKKVLSYAEARRELAKNWELMINHIIFMDPISTQRKNMKKWMRKKDMNGLLKIY